MKIFALSLIIGLALCGTARADVVIQDGTGGSTVTELPGNARVYNSSRDTPRLTIYNGDDSIAYRALVRPYVNDRIVLPNSAPTSQVNEICGGERRASEKNRCVRDVIKQNEKLRRKYNN